MNSPVTLLETGEPVAVKAARRVREGAIRTHELRNEV
jgi:hypothetical protein